MLATTLDPGAPHFLVYHFVVDGTARASVEGSPELELSAGDIVVFPHGDPHLLSARSGTSAIEGAAVLRRITTRDLSPMHAGGGGVTTRFICGYLTLDPLLCAPILESLPPWLEQSILHLLEESASERAGSDAMLAKLSEALFVDTLRRYIAGLSDQATGWLSAARDVVVGKSAAQALTSTSKGIADVAAAVGYESEASFNRAFKRAFGLPRARYRRQRKNEPRPTRGGPDKSLASSASELPMRSGSISKVP